MVPPGFLALLVLVAIHIFANRPTILGWVWHRHRAFLSFASGVSLAYIFVDLLPALARGEPVLKRAFEPLVPFFEVHTYLVALLGILFYYGMQSLAFAKKHPLLPASGYFIFNFFVGVSLSDSSNPEIQPITLFTIAIGLHYFIRDHWAKISRHRGWLLFLIAALLLGYVVGYLTHIPDALAAVGMSFVAGGVILNVFKYELPKEEKQTFFCFVLGALLYAAILLGVGEVK